MIGCSALRPSRPAGYLFDRRKGLTRLLGIAPHTGPMAALTASGPVNLVHLARYTGGDREVNCEVFRLFSDHCRRSLGSLQTFLGAADGKGWREAAHALKGAALGLGA